MTAEPEIYELMRTVWTPKAGSQDLKHHPAE
jgi:hypothetical protein